MMMIPPATIIITTDIMIIGINYNYKSVRVSNTKAYILIYKNKSIYTTNI